MRQQLPEPEVESVDQWWQKFEALLVGLQLEAE